MKVSPKYKRFKRINFVGDTLPLPDKRSSIIRTMQGYVLHGLILNHPYNHTHNYLITSHIQVNTKPKTYPIIEMIPILGYYSYATKYHKLASMNIPGYQCSNIYIDIEKGTLLYKDIQ